MNGDRIVVETTRDRIRGVADAWEQQTTSHYRWARNAERAERATILERLRTLDVETATAANVKAIIGNGGWVTESCDVCCVVVEAWVRLGDAPDYDSTTVYVCADCLALASAALAARA